MQDLLTDYICKIHTMRVIRSYGLSCRSFLWMMAAILASSFLAIPVHATAKAEIICERDHIHTASCFADMILHTHDGFCYDDNGCLICPMPELEKHEHGDACYEIAEQETVPDEQKHVHTDECFAIEKGEVICAVAQQHIHSDLCYESVVQEVFHEHTEECFEKQKGKQSCTLVESEGHTHGDSCFVSNEILLCESEESEAHAHDPACFGKMLVCETQEDSGHVHEDACFEWETVLSCGKEGTHETVVLERILICTEDEQVLHIHNDECYEQSRVLICTQEEHSTEPAQPEKRLICTLNEWKNHVHTKDCYATYLAGEGKLICGELQIVTHQHTQMCLDPLDGTFLCVKTEDNEEVAEPTECPAEEETEKPTEDSIEEPNGEQTEAPTEYPIEEPTEESAEEPVEEPMNKLDSDPTADKEQCRDWEETVEDVELTGAWPYDLLAVAQSQLGYRESTRNFILAENGDKKGYTRYGDWYGIPYGDWCAMFASFCLNYAGIEEFPLHCNCRRWINVLEESGMYAEVDAYIPKPGDLVFFDHSRKSTTSENVPVKPDHVAIVAEVVPATQERPAELITIEGNHNNSVCYETRELDDPRIIGYGILPDGPAAIYSCDLEAHTHDAVCYDEEETIICQLQEHFHNDICRSRKLIYADESMCVGIVLSDAVYLPADLKLEVSEVTADSGQVFDAMVAAVDATTSESVEDVHFWQVTILSDGKSVRLPAGVQAHVLISLKSPLAAKNGEEGCIVVLSENFENEEMTFSATEAILDDFWIADEGCWNLLFTANKLSGFAVG